MAHVVLLREGNVNQFYEYFCHQYSYALVMDSFLLDVKLVVSLSPDRLLWRRILCDFISGRYALEFNDALDFPTVSDLIDHYTENYIFDGTSGVITRLRLRKPCYTQVMSLRYLSGVVIQKNNLPVPEEVSESLVGRARHF